MRQLEEGEILYVSATLSAEYEEDTGNTWVVLRVPGKPPVRFGPLDVSQVESLRDSLDEIVGLSGIR